MSFDRPRRGDTPIDKPLANPRVDNLQSLARAIKARYPAISAHLDPASPGRPATLRTAYLESSEDIECDFTEQGWRYALSRSGQPIGPACDPAGAAYAIARLLGLRRNM